MPNSLSQDLRNQLARVTLEACETAEPAAQSALEHLAVHERDYRPHMSTEQRRLRNSLRERGRGLGDARDERTGKQNIRRLTEDVAYEHWHRLLFTRFLGENGLLHTDASHGNVPITLADCEELAPELGARDGFELACRFASEILPGVFRPNDPVFELTLAAEDQVRLRKLLDSLPREVFTADDSLGWTYQFWQARRKDEVNASERKVGADDLAAVTQLFTDDYMVSFLLHNTLGAWWAGKILRRRPEIARRATTEVELRAACSLPGTDWAYLRFVRDQEEWRPAAGTFQDWPDAARDIRLLDPCMGSGHFLVAALPLLVAMRVAEEGLMIQAAFAAVLAENIFGLEIDTRCTQIAAFNIALTAWKANGYYSLPRLHVACSGLNATGRETDWVELAGTDERQRIAMARLYGLFREAPTLGSLIDPRLLGGDVLRAGFKDVSALLDIAVQREAPEEPARELAVIAHGVADAASILAERFTLVATNVPYLSRSRQGEVLRDYCDQFHPLAKHDLATAFLQRCLSFASGSGTIAVVVPTNWQTLSRYEKLRQEVLARSSFTSLAVLGAGAFETIGGEVVSVALLCASVCTPRPDHSFCGIDASAGAPTDKQLALRTAEPRILNQALQSKNPDSRILLEEHRSGTLLKEFAESRYGLRTGDLERLARYCWEIPCVDNRWKFFQGTVDKTVAFGGRERVLLWDHDKGALRELADAGIASIQGAEAWGRPGVIVSLMGALPATLYSGDLYDNGTAVIWPRREEHLEALFAFCSSEEFVSSVRRIDRSIKVTNQTLLKVPFDLKHWQRVAATEFPKGLPKAYSGDLTQWLFNGQPSSSDQPLHVAVARLLGYEWPRQTGSSFPDCPVTRPDGLEKMADADGIVCLPPISREQAGAQRLRAVLVKALGRFDERALLAGAGLKGSKAGSLEEWLRDEFFEQHCDLFHQRPFIWHIWDGRKDGFHALLNYHRLDHATLQKLTYSYLGDWIRYQEEAARADKPGADERLGAARELQAELAKILEGEAPYDLFVRWKPLCKQPLGWHPDLTDGVRLNIRPFATADVLRKRVKIKWEKDRGKEPPQDRAEYPWFWREGEPDTDPEPGRQFAGNRWNSVHLTIQQKRRARGGK